MSSLAMVPAMVPNQLHHVPSSHSTRHCHVNKEDVYLPRLSTQAIEGIHIINSNIYAQATCAAGWVMANICRMQQCSAAEHLAEHMKHHQLGRRNLPWFQQLLKLPDTPPRQHCFRNFTGFRQRVCVSARVQTPSKAALQLQLHRVRRHLEL